MVTEDDIFDVLRLCIEQNDKCVMIDSGRSAGASTWLPCKGAKSMDRAECKEVLSALENKGLIKKETETRYTGLKLNFYRFATPYEIVQHKRNHDTNK